MPTDASVISSFVEEIISASELLSQGSRANEASAQSRLISAAEKLIIATRDPQENIYAMATSTAQNAVIRSAMGLQAFEIIPSTGESISVQEIASRVSADEVLVERIMRACAARYMFCNTSPGNYSHNALSLCFKDSTNRDMFRQMYDFGGKGTYALPEFLERTNWRNPEDYSKSAWHIGHATAHGIWEFLAEEPERMKVFNNGMKSLTTVVNKDKGPYPFDTELSGDVNQVVLVDVGGGRGQALERIKASFPDLKGRLILQDQESFVQDAITSGLMHDIEAMVASFFEPNPVKCAKAYHFRRIFHDWSDGISLKILQNTLRVMGEESRILISDNLVPDQGATWGMALQDLNMMAFAGIERTEEQ